MKLSELHHLAAFLDVLFNLFKEHNITSCLSPLKDLDGMKKLLLDSEIVGKSYLFNINQYSIDIDFSRKTTEEDIYYFLFGRSHEGMCSSVLLDLWGSRKFMTIEIDSEKYPPFVRDFLDESGKLRTSYISEEDEMIPVDEKDIMSMDELKDFLVKNNIRRDVTWIEVD